MKHWYMLSHEWTSKGKGKRVICKRPHIVWETARIGKSSEVRSRLVAVQNWDRGEGSNGKWLLMCTGISWGWWRCSKAMLWWWLHNSVNLLKPSKLYNLSRKTLWYIENYSLKKQSRQKLIIKNI